MGNNNNNNNSPLMDIDSAGSKIQKKNINGSINQSDLLMKLKL